MEVTEVAARTKNEEEVGRAATARVVVAHRRTRHCVAIIRDQDPAPGLARTTSVYVYIFLMLIPANAYILYLYIALLTPFD